LKANLIPGVILQPSGVYAAHRAQEAGCTYIRST
jgi:intracellular sulfur oxidation DsrE/DsrF family protein